MTFLLLVASAVWASEPYPNAVDTDLGMSCTPTCNLCHASAGGGGPVPKAFAQAMVAEGLEGNSNTDALAAALDALRAAGTDSDGDGTSDVDELEAGANPNDESAFCGDAAVTPPSYGCLNTTAAAPGALGVLLGLAAVVRRRSKRVV
jgi:hypothetical protein